MMRRPLDTPERRAALRSSAHIAAARHLARSYGVSMRRRRRVGAVVYDIGPHHGELTFTDTGLLADAHLFGVHQGELSFPDLAGVLEYGAYRDEAAPTTGPIALVLDTALDAAQPLTGPIPLPETSQVLEVFIPAATEAYTPEPLPRRGALVSVAVPLVLTWPTGPWTKTIAQRRAEVLEELPTARSLWGRFAVGLILVFQVVALVLLAAHGYAPALNLSIASGIVAVVVGLPLVVSAIKANDERVEALRAVGLK